MPLQQTPFYRSHLADLHRLLLAHETTQTYLTGTRVRFDGVELGPTNSFEFTFGTLSTLEFVHLFSVFDGSRVHQQAEKRPGYDDAPPGMYFTVINPTVIQPGHKNKLGIFSQETGTAGLFIEGVHIDHYFLDKHKTPRGLGAIAFTLGAITAHLAGLDQISLIAAGGKGFDQRHVGFKVWPKLGFDADLVPGEQLNAPHLRNCESVQDILAVDPAWWEAEGSQRLMTFDLRSGSRSWHKLLTYAGENFSVGGPHD
ncbi:MULTISPECIES: hypothetical protein [unclassified Variovorax]|uniref:hypothetical protein n=1 Tax=unclassified Variovorax TaxID=663243 RepID=UPI003ECEEEED